MSELPYFPAMLAVLSAFLFALSIQTQNLGLAHTDPSSGTLVNIGTTCVIYWFFSPFFVEASYWLTSAAALFAMIGLFQPVLSANLSVASVKIMGPTLTSGLAATNPLFAAIFAILILNESLTWPVAVGTGAVVAGVVVSAIRPGGTSRRWPLWALVLPLGTAFFRAAGLSIIMIGYKELASPYFAGMVSYTVSLFVASIAFKVQKRSFSSFNWGYGWFAMAGVLNGISIYSVNTALKYGQLLTVAPIVACLPVFSILLSLLIFKRETITWRTTLTIALVVSGVVLIIMQF